MEKKKMSKEYYDVPMTLHVVIAVSAEDEQKAIEKLHTMADDELICLLAAQVHFVGMDEKDTLQ